jgi:hypothetical protein
VALTLAYTPLILAPPDLTAWVERSINPTDFTPWGYRNYLGPGLADSTVRTTMSPPIKPKIGRLVWPATASRWAYAFYLCDATTLVNIADSAYGPNFDGQNRIALQMDSQIQQNTDSTNDTYEYISCQMYLMPPVPLSALQGGDKHVNTNYNVNNLYLLYLVDKRFYWWYQSAALQIPDGGMSWDSVFEEAGSVIGEEILFDTVADEYVMASPLLSANYEPAPPWVDAVCYNVGQRLIVDINTDQVLSVRWDTSVRNRIKEENKYPPRAVRAGNYRFPDVY